jgi:L-lactate dehydrogenase complex protein LldG
MTDDRALVFARIREALQTPRPFHQAPSASPATATTALPYQSWLPAVTDTPEGRRAAFAERSELLKTEFLTIPRSALAATVRDLRARHGWARAAWHRTELTAAAVEAAGLPLLSTDGPYSTADLERADVSFTGCDALIAQTGSVLLTTRSAGGRALSILPPHHVVLATSDQLIADLPSAMRLLKARYADDLPSMICLETGPSRTGDIERILVLGAHGPKKLTVIMVEEAT